MEDTTVEINDLAMLKPFGFYEFFAGGGMARLGLGAAWSCWFANDFDEKKIESYRANFAPAVELHHGDIAKVVASDLPDFATLAWASFPCQDLSLAGNGRGLAGNRSGVFWSFWNLMKELSKEGRRPPIVALENVSGLLTSHGGQDLINLITAFVADGYRIGAVALNGAHFVPQSRPRVFLVAVSKEIVIPERILSKEANPAYHPQSLQEVVRKLDTANSRDWLWWNMPMPVGNPPHLREIIEHEPSGVVWHSKEQTQRLLDLMAPAHIAKVEEAKQMGGLQVGTIYKRTRLDEQRAEVRFDGISGCLRTPSGGSSRQLVMIVEGENVRTRLISPRETARLMGLPENYKLPSRYNDTYHLTGDGLVVPAVSWIERHIIRPLALSAQRVIEQRRGLLDQIAS